MCKLSFWLSDKASGKRYNLTTMMLLLDGCADVSLSGDTARLFGRDRLMAMRIDGGGETLKGWLDYNRFINKQQTISDSVSYAEAEAYFANHGDDYAWAHPDEPYSLYLQGKNLEAHFRYTSEQLGDMAEHFKGNGDAEGYREFAKKIEEAKKTVKGMAYAANPKINIVSISCDKNLADWAKAMKEENMPWKQVALPQDKALNRAASEAYKVRFIPYLVVIDPQGAVIMATSDAKEIMRMW